MAEELQPKGLKEGAADPHAPTSTAEDRKAALALSSLDAPPDDTNNTSKGATAEAATDAMKQLSVSSTALDTPKEEKKAVKVQGKDVELLIDQLLVSKAKATELLKAHEGDAVKAMVAYVSAPA